MGLFVNRTNANNAQRGKNYIAYKETQNIPILNFNLKIKFHYDITEYCIVGHSQYTMQGRLLSLEKR